MKSKIQQLTVAPQYRRGTVARRKLAALIASAACGFTAGPAGALELDELTVESALGQPLRASIAYALSPNEQLHDYCIFLQPAAQGGTFSGSAFPSLTNARLSVANGRISIVGTTPINEPMLDVGLRVSCPYTPNLQRSYTVLLDPYLPELGTRTAPAVVQQPQAENQLRSTRPETSARTSSQSNAGQPNAAQLTQSAELPTITMGSTHRVQAGETLFGIATRVEQRPLGVWETVNRIFAANPQAFIDGDNSKLKAGSILTIPHLDAAEQTLSATETSATIATEASRINTLDLQYPGVTSQTDSGAEAVLELADIEGSAKAAAPVTSTNARNETATPESPIAAEERQAQETPVAEEAETLPAVDIAPDAERIIAETVTTETANQTQLVYWLAGAGLGLFALLVMFGRRLRSSTAAPSDPDATAVAEALTEQVDVGSAEAVAKVDYDIGAQASIDTELMLDADLSAGTGLSARENIEVAQDFGFSGDSTTTSGLDLVFEEEAPEKEHPATDVLPTHAKEESMVVEKEVLPNELDEYDMSMIVDATKQKFGSGDITAQDLMAVAIADVKTIHLGDDTLNQEVDYKILEQDYEDELTATQILNDEIEKAAQELAARLDDDLSDVIDTATVADSDMDKTEVLSPEIMSDLDDTGVNEALGAEHPEQGVSANADATTSLPA